MPSVLFYVRLCLFVALAAVCGCTINKSRMATEQLVVSDAVDRVVAQVDFSPLSGHNVYFDTKYLSSAKLPGSPNVEYLTSSLRQQMLAYDCRLKEKPEEAELVVEARVGALGNDGNEATYGIPGSAAVSAAAAFATGFPTGGTFPELSVGRRNHQWGAAKIGLFAYDRKSNERVWQAGVSTSASQARELWVMGIGPFQQGRVYRDAKSSMKDKPGMVRGDHQLQKLDSLEAYAASIDFQTEPRRLAEAAAAAEALPSPPFNPSSPQVLPASATTNK